MCTRFGLVLRSNRRICVLAALVPFPLVSALTATIASQKINDLENWELYSPLMSKFITDSIVCGGGSLPAPSAADQGAFRRVPANARCARPSSCLFAPFSACSQRSSVAFAFFPQPSRSAREIMNSDQSRLQFAPRDPADKRVSMFDVFTSHGMSADEKTLLRALRELNESVLKIWFSAFSFPHFAYFALFQDWRVLPILP